VLRNILVSPSLIGVNSAGVPAWESIIDASTHQRLVDKLATDPARRTNPHGVKSSKYALGGGLLVCGRCGKPLSAIARKEATTKFVCRAFQNGDDPRAHPKREDGTSEGRVSIDAKALEDYLFEKSRAHLNDLPFWESVKRKREGADSDIARLRVERTDREGERDRARRAYIAGIMPEREAQIEVARLDAEIDRLTQRIENAHGGPTAHDVWGGRQEALDYWAHWEVGERRLFFRSLIERVTVGDWPKGVPTTTLPKSAETADEFTARKAKNAADAMKARVAIQWRE